MDRLQRIQLINRSLLISWWLFVIFSFVLLTRFLADGGFADIKRWFSLWLATFGLLQFVSGLCGASFAGEIAHMQSGDTQQRASWLGHFRISRSPDSNGIARRGKYEMVFGLLWLGVAALYFLVTR